MAVICIDFGTSASKVAIEHYDDLFAVPLGELSGDPVKKHPFDSSLLFSTDGNVYLGFRAIEQSLAPGRQPEQRLDSMKSFLTQGKPCPLDQLPVPVEANATRTAFSIRDALVLLLAELIALTNRFVEDSFGQRVIDDAELRFSRPVFDDPGHSAWVDGEMSAAIGWARTIAPRMRNPESCKLTAEEARGLLDKAYKATANPLAQKGIPEPLAASVLHFSGQNQRLLAAIVDIGAGTTDIGLFVAVVPDGMNQIRQAQILSDPMSVLKAGDELDRILFSLTTDGEHLEPRHMTELKLKIRSYKEQLFNLNETIPTLYGGKRLQRILRHQFEDQPDYRAMSGEIAGALGQLIEGAGRMINMFANASFHAPRHIALIPAGGGAKLPLMAELARIDWRALGVNLPLKLYPPTPEDLANQFGEDFPKLAVALGGAAALNPNFQRWQNA